MVETDKQKFIQRFKDLYQKKEKKDISDAEALEHFERLILLVRSVYKPIKAKNYAD